MRAREAADHRRRPVFEEGAQAKRFSRGCPCWSRKSPLCTRSASSDPSPGTTLANPNWVRHGLFDEELPKPPSALSALLSATLSLCTSAGPTLARRAAQRCSRFFAGCCLHTSSTISLSLKFQKLGTLAQRRSTWCLPVPQDQTWEVPTLPISLILFLTSSRSAKLGECIVCVQDAPTSCLSTRMSFTCATHCERLGNVYFRYSWCCAVACAFFSNFHVVSLCPWMKKITWLASFA